MAALKLNPNPTFNAKVGIPVAGEEQPAVIVCTFKHMTREAYAAFAEGLRSSSASDVDTLMQVLAGWDGPDEPFSREAVAKLVSGYHGAAFAISQAFADELTKARAKN